MAFRFVENLNQTHKRVAFELLLLISTFVMLKASFFPYSSEFVFSNILGFWNSIKCIFSSHLYICLIINLMVALIATSSTFHQTQIENRQDPITTTNLDAHGSQISNSPPPPAAPPPPPPPSLPETGSTFYEICDLDDSSAHIGDNTKKPNFIENISTLPLRQEAHDTEKTVYQPNDYPDLSRPNEENPAVEIKLSKENENEEDDTMEATWRSITGGGKQKMKKKELKKIETWDVRRLESEELVRLTPKWKELRKSETFNDSLSVTCRGGLRRDPSTSLEELNKKVEDFIKNFNDSMKLQRQESDQRFLDMMKRGI